MSIASAGMTGWAASTLSYLGLLSSWSLHESAPADYLSSPVLRVGHDRHDVKERQVLMQPFHSMNLFSQPPWASIQSTSVAILSGLFLFDLHHPTGIKHLTEHIRGSAQGLLRVSTLFHLSQRTMADVSTIASVESESLSNHFRLLTLTCLRINSIHYSEKEHTAKIGFENRNATQTALMVSTLSVSFTGHWKFYFSAQRSKLGRSYSKCYLRCRRWRWTSSFSYSGWILWAKWQTSRWKCVILFYFAICYSSEQYLKPISCGRVSREGIYSVWWYPPTRHRDG